MIRQFQYTLLLCVMVFSFCPGQSASPIKEQLLTDDYTLKVEFEKTGENLAFTIQKGTRPGDYCAAYLKNGAVHYGACSDLERAYSKETKYIALYAEEGVVTIYVSLAAIDQVSGVNSHDAYTRKIVHSVHFFTLEENKPLYSFYPDEVFPNLYDDISDRQNFDEEKFSSFSTGVKLEKRGDITSSEYVIELSKETFCYVVDKFLVPKQGGGHFLNRTYLVFNRKGEWLENSIESRSKSLPVLALDNYGDFLCFVEQEFENVNSIEKVDGIRVFIKDVENKTIFFDRTYSRDYALVGGPSITSENYIFFRLLDRRIAKNKYIIIDLENREIRSRYFTKKEEELLSKAAISWANSWDGIFKRYSFDVEDIRQ